MLVRLIPGIAVVVAAFTGCASRPVNERITAVVRGENTSTRIDSRRNNAGVPANEGRNTQRAGYMPSDNQRAAASEVLSFLSKH